MIGTTIAFASIYGLWRWLDEEIEEEVKKEEWQEAKRVQWRRSNDTGGETGKDDDEDGEAEDEDEEEEEGLIFFPTGLSRPKKKEYYKGSDPEWQEFVRIAPDRTRIDRIRGELISLVRSLAVKNPTYTRLLGKINPEAGSIWIEVRFPDGPPIEYERPGYELTEDLTLRKTTRPVDQVHHQRLNSALYPTAVAHSVYLDMKRRVRMQWRGWKKYMGWEDEGKAPTAQKVLTQLSAPPPSTPKSPVPTTTASSTSAPPPTPSNTSDAQGKDVSSTSSSASPSSNSITERFSNSLPDPRKVHTMDLTFFRMMFRKNHKHTQPQPPRGTFAVTGLIEIIGTKAKLTLDVVAAYDPKMGRYVMLAAKLRSLTEYKQTPKGGP
jgi:hypothetical protein